MSTQQYGARTETIKLPCGYIDSNGTLFTKAHIREMDFESELLMGTMSDGNPMEEVVARCLVGLSTEDESDDITDPAVIAGTVIPDMLKGDWDWVLLRIVKLTLYQTEKYTFEMLCPNSACKRQDTYEYDLADVDCREMPDRRRREIVVTTRPDNTEVVFRHLKGSDSEGLAIIRDSDSDVLGKTLALHLVRVGDHVVSQEQRLTDRLREGVALLQKAMPFMDDRERTRQLLLRSGGRPDLAVTSRCAHCGTRFKHIMPVDPTLLLPSAGIAAESRNPAADF